MNIMGDKIDFSLLATILSAGIFVILAGGLLLSYNTAQLIVIGVVGYTMVFLFRRIGKKQNDQQRK
ncbi:MAG: hypothetical protein U0M96_04090 [Eggerthellaceae bacterium]